MGILVNIWNKIINFFYDLFPQKRKYIEEKDYSLLDYEDDKLCVKILSGKYKNVIYHYTQARLDERHGYPKLQFGYNIINSYNFAIEDLENNNEFTNLMGDILTEIIIKKTNE